MKFNEIMGPKTDLSDQPSVMIIRALGTGDKVVFDGGEWTVQFPPKKTRKGIWLIGISNQYENKYIKIVENIKPKMTIHEKKTMVKNIQGVVKMFDGDDKRLLTFIENYHHNLSAHNNYDDTDVRECMREFPIDLLKKSGVVV